MSCDNCDCDSCMSELAESEEEFEDIDFAPIPPYPFNAEDHQRGIDQVFDNYQGATIHNEALINLVMRNMEVLPYHFEPAREAIQNCLTELVQTGQLERLKGKSGGYRKINSNGEKMKTLKDLAREALDIQDGCNLSGIVHSFSRAMTDLREIARKEGWENTSQLNNHPIAILYADKLVSLAKSAEDAAFGGAYRWALEQVKENKID